MQTKKVYQEVVYWSVTKNPLARSPPSFERLVAPTGVKPVRISFEKRRSNQCRSSSLAERWSVLAFRPRRRDRKRRPQNFHTRRVTRTRKTVRFPGDRRRRSECSRHGRARRRRYTCKHACDEIACRPSNASTNVFERPSQWDARVHFSRRFFHPHTHVRLSSTSLLRVLRVNDLRDYNV